VAYRRVSLVLIGGRSPQRKQSNPARRYDQLLRFQMAGYEPITVQLDRKNSVWRNLVRIHPVGWIIGAVVDLSTAAAWSFDPSSVSVQLQPTSKSAVPADNGHQ
jgi:hypothetical protein